MVKLYKQNDKTTFEIYVTVDGKFITLSNGYLDYSKKISESNDRQDHWVMDKPNSTYLIMLAAGEFGIFEDKFNKIFFTKFKNNHLKMPCAIK